MSAVFIDGNVHGSFFGCKFYGSGKGIEVKQGSLTVSDGEFYTKGNPVDFDGGGDLDFQRNKRFAPLDDLTPSAPISLSPEVMDRLVYGIVRRHFGR